MVFEVAWIVLLSALAFAVFWFGSCSASAQVALPTLAEVSAPCAPEVVVRRRAVVEHEGETGIWNQLEVSRCMLGRLSALPLYAQRVSLLEQRLTLSDERYQLMQRQVELAVQGEEEATTALEAAMRRVGEAEEERDQWYRHPLLWVVVGGIVVAGLEALAIWGFSEVAP